MGPACIESELRSAIPICPHGELHLVPKMKRLLHPQHRFHQCLRILQASDPRKTVLYMILQKLQLLLIGNVLQRTSTALHRFLTYRCHAIGRWFLDLHKTCVCKVLFHLHHLD